jgi:nickel-dependent lactate racemase
LENPVGGVSSPSSELSGFSDFLSDAQSLLIIINDATRPTPTPAILEALIPYIEAGGEKRKITLITATGAHRAPDEAEYHQIFGAYYDKFRPHCIHHDARKMSDMVDLGATRTGTPILLNKILFEVDKIIVTGSVEPHYFAGFTGGRKSILPGVAAYKTIEANHKNALSPAAHSTQLEGNPVNEDMLDALSLIEAKTPIFSIMTVLDKNQELAAAFAGDINESFYAAVLEAKKIFCVTINEAADIVISIAKFPMDIDLYQSQKAIDNGACALKSGGTLLLVSSCRDGIGDKTYANLLSSSESPEDALKKIEKEYKLGYHKAAKMAQVSARATIKAVTGLPADVLASMFIEAAKSPQDALDEAIEKAKLSGVKTPKILVLPDGCVTVPEIKHIS